jgi:hypothetical protein
MEVFPGILARIVSLLPLTTPGLSLRWYRVTPFSEDWTMSNLIPRHRSRPWLARLVALTALLAGTLPGLAFADGGRISCNPAQQQAIIQSAVLAVQQDAKANDAIRKQILNQPDSKLLACVGSYWPGVNISFPTMDQLVKAAEAYVVNQACMEARQAMGQVTNPILSATGGWNTSIPGLGLPSGINTNSGSSNGSCVTVNGQQNCSGSATSGWTSGLQGIL